MGFEEWFDLGLQQGWISKIFCYTHDGVPIRPEEEEQCDEDLPCIASVRVFGQNGTPTDLIY